MAHEYHVTEGRGAVDLIFPNFVRYLVITLDKECIITLS